jgi:hypothetical protein
MTERRAVIRVPVINSAKILLGRGFGQGVLDCLVLDETATGVMVELGALVPLPDELTIRMTGGATYQAQRCWNIGTKAGLQFLGGQVVTGETALRMLKIADLLQNQGLIAAVATLRAARFFDHLELRRAAEDAEGAFLRFEEILRGCEAIETHFR